MPRIHWTDHNESSTTASSRSHASERSDVSRSTVPTDTTDCGESPARSPYSQRPDAYVRRVEPVHEKHYAVPACREVVVGGRAADGHQSTTSVGTYASTSEEELDEDDDLYEDDSEYDVPSYPPHTPYPTDAVPATPRDFSEHFPSSRKLTIRHDDSTMDGNMNLRVDTQIETRRGKRLNLTLFHLRMHDLRSRDFSLRRYCRDSGREVCHTIRKYQKPPSERPTLQRSFSSALAPFRLNRGEARPTTSAGLKRTDSGYASFQAAFEDETKPKLDGRARAKQLLPTNTVKLEFSNYAHVDVKRRGAKSNKRYVFEYWDIRYTWKRTVRQDGDVEQVSFRLYRQGYDQALAYIVPINMTPGRRHEELSRGGWIPPCTLRLCHDSIISAVPDVSDVIVASGLMALVDDCIKRHFHPKETVQLHIPLSRNTSFKVNVDALGPRRLLDEMFHRNSRRPDNGPAHPSLGRRFSAF